MLFKFNFLEKLVSVFYGGVRSRHLFQILILPWLLSNTHSGFSMSVGFIADGLVPFGERVGG
jgi:hypothetical protein